VLTIGGLVNAFCSMPTSGWSWRTPCDEQLIDWPVVAGQLMLIRGPELMSDDGIASPNGEVLPTMMPLGIAGAVDQRTALAQVGVGAQRFNRK
jgi:hypothetical protein